MPTHERRPGELGFSGCLLAVPLAIAVPFLVAWIGLREPDRERMESRPPLIPTPPPAIPHVPFRPPAEPSPAPAEDHPEPPPPEYRRDFQRSQYDAIVEDKAKEESAAKVEAVEAAAVADAAKTKRAATLLKSGSNLEKSGKTAAALETYKRIVNEFGDTDSARPAAVRIKALDHP